MIYRDDQGVERFWGRRQFHAFLDQSARAIFGVSAEEFAEGYRAGRWLRHPKAASANDLACVITFAFNEDAAERAARLEREGTPTLASTRSARSCARPSARGRGSRWCSTTTT
jgi:hypothetical protein